MPVQILFKRRRREARLPPRPLLCSYLETEVGAEQEGLRLARNIAVSALVDRRDIIFVEQIVGVCAQLEIVVHGIAEQRVDDRIALGARGRARSEEQTSELQSLMRTSYAVLCLQKK